MIVIKDMFLIFSINLRYLQTGSQPYNVCFTQRYMFWTDVSTRGKMERADLTGENRLTLSSLYYGWVPISAVIEFNAGRIYWMSRYTMFYTDRDGYSRKYLRRYIRENINPVDLALYEDNLYWVDTNSRSIHWFNKSQPGQMLSFGHLTNGILVGAVVSDESRQPAGKLTSFLAITRS